MTDLKAALWAERCELARRVAELEAEVARLLRGDWTEAEIHDLCHNLHGTVDAEAFAAGCAAEQRRIYGCAPDADRCASLRELAAREALPGLLG